MSFIVLNIREILDFLIGDFMIPSTSIYDSKDLYPKTVNGIILDIQLPYLSGNQINELYPRFALDYPIYKNMSPSRWIMMKNIITRLDRIGRVGELLAYLFSKHRFQSCINQFRSVDEFDKYYACVLRYGLEYINKQLYISKKKIFSSNGKFILTDLESVISIPVESINTISSEYVKTLPDRIKIDLDNNDFDSVINKCRTLIEEVLCYIIEQKGETPVDTGKIEQLQKQCKKLLKMNSDSGQDARVLQLLSGLTSIISAISSLRNIGSDAHGVGSKRINIGQREAILISNAAQTYCEYILSVFTHPNV